MTRWYLIAGDTVSRVYEAQSQGAVRLIHSMENELGRTPNRELTRDKPGTVLGGGRSASRYRLTAGRDPHKEGLEQFAKQVVSYLNGARNNNSFNSLVVVASPILLGILRKSMRGQLLKMVEAWENKDMERAKEHELAEFMTGSPPPRRKEGAEEASWLQL